MKRFFIYGGCVSRDSFETIKENNSLVHYVARQSLISATSRPEQRINLNKLSDNFSSRMIKGDIQSSLIPRVEVHAGNTDIMLFDILSERLGVYRLSGGTYITNSTELAASKILNDFTEPKTLIRMGTDRHFDLWMNSVLILKNKLIERGIFDKTFALQVQWTDTTIQGTNTPKFRDWDARRGNETYSRYYSYLDDQGFNLIRPPKEISLSDENHKWGPSQYHYQPEFYKFVAETLESK